MSLLLAAQGKAVVTLKRALDDPSPNVRVRAARALLELGQRAADDDMDQRLTELERRSHAWGTAPVGPSAWPTWSA